MLSDSDIQRAAGALGVEPAVIQAVIEVETGGAAFLPDGRPTILFEAHIFHRLTGGRFDASHPHLSSPTWSRALYRGSAGEWERLEEAQQLDRAAALQSASWGLFQIMGFNYRLCGFASVEEFVEAMKDEDRQLDAFVALIKAQRLDDELRRKDWAGFARRYNGPSYSANKYDLRLRRAYQRAQGDNDGRN